ncbi:MAG: hypothetical protein P4L31_01305 [Candidatus Babeliales bacterium]|nr:hypothetical protein [Candidatus Babeliales bacterium]
MTQFMHAVIAISLFATTWHLILKKLFIRREEELEFWQALLDKNFFGDKQE